MSVPKQTQSTLKELVYTALTVALMSVCAWITIPFFAVPFTMQTFAVFAALMLLGGVRGTIAVAVYLALGAVGAPVFSGFRGGIGALVGPTGGYLFGFLITALCYLACEKLIKTKKAEYPALVVGLILCYLCGTLWFAAVGTKDFVSALSICVLPFILPDLIKLTLAFFLVRRLRKLGFGLGR